MTSTTGTTLYHTLFTREDNGKWYPQFGDYVKRIVRDEIENYRGEYKRKDIKIVSHCDSIWQTDDLIALAN